MYRINYYNLRAARKRQHLTLSKVGELIGLNKSTVAAYENRTSKIPAETLLFLITMYDAKFEDIIEKF